MNVTFSGKARGLVVILLLSYFPMIQVRIPMKTFTVVFILNRTRNKINHTGAGPSMEN